MVSWSALVLKLGCTGRSTDSIPHSYTQVCGFVRGYSFVGPDAFGAFGRTSSEPLSGNYVDGVSITYGTPLNHLWTYAAGNSESGGGTQNCPWTQMVTRPLFLHTSAMTTTVKRGVELVLIHYGMVSSVEEMKDHVVPALHCHGSLGTCWALLMTISWSEFVKMKEVATKILDWNLSKSTCVK